MIDCHNFLLLLRYWYDALIIRRELIDRSEFCGIHYFDAIRRVK
jgi:hypothetical protein